MPSLGFDGPEATGVRHHVAIIKHQLLPMLHEIRRVQDLEMMNSGDLLEIEMNQMLLYLPSEKDLPQEDRNYLAGSLYGVCGWVKEFVSNIFFSQGALEGQDRGKRPHDKTTDDPADDTSITVDYSKTQALKGGHSHGTTLPPSLVPLAETKREFGEVLQMVTDFNNSNRSRYNAGLQNVGELASTQHRSLMPPDESHAKHDLENLRQSQHSFSTLLDALVKAINTVKCDHVAKFQIRDPAGSSGATENVQHKIFLSSCQSRDKWQESICTVFSHLPVSQRKLEGLQDICKAIQDSLDEERTLHISVHEGLALQNPESSQIIRHPPLRPILALKELLLDRRPKDQFTPYNKVMIARNLARALLQMYSADMQNREWTARDIYFLFSKDEERVYEGYNPYSLLPRQLSNGADSKIVKKKFPILVSFSKLLLEIAHGETLGPFDRRLDIALMQLAEDDVVTEKVPSGYIDAIKICLTTNKAENMEANEVDDDDDEYEDEGEKKDQCLIVIESVIALLEEARMTFAGCARKDPNEKLFFKVSKDIKTAPNIEPSIRAHEHAVMPKPASTPMLNGSTSIELYDGQQHRCTSDTRRDRARKFLDLAETFRTRISYQSKEGEGRIRIAILDTGVDKYNGFIRGVLKSRNENPLKSIESFVGRSASDVDGHGTNVAALVLEIAPEANLYIAKISQGKETYGADNIVRAIEWARKHDVHIINMSFGLTSWNAKIQIAIEQAETEGVIICAAACNHGGNKSRSFPARMDKVLCIHATDGFGNSSGMNPSAVQQRDNIGTLGVGIPSKIEQDMYLEGTSYSTPVATGIAANILRLVLHETDAGNLTEIYRKHAFSRKGMQDIFSAMSSKRDGYDYVAPWPEMWRDDATTQDIITKIKDALRYFM